MSRSLMAPHRWLAIAALGLMLGLGGCGGGGGSDEAAREPDPNTPAPPVQAFTLSGTVSGLNGRTVELIVIVNAAGLNQGAHPDDRVEIFTLGDGPFSVSAIPQGSWVVMPTPNPADGGPGLACRFSPSDAGLTRAWVVDSLQGDVAVDVACRPSYALSITISGATPERPDTIEATAPGPGKASVNVPADASAFHTFFSGIVGLVEGEPYEVYSRDGRCQVINGVDVMPAADVTLQVDCGIRSVSYTIEGLAGRGLEVSLTRDGRLFESRSHDGDGEYIFDARLYAREEYLVSVTRQPVDPAQQCQVENARGTVGDADVTNVKVICPNVQRRWSFIRGAETYLTGTTNTGIVDLQIEMPEFPGLAPHNKKMSVMLGIPDLDIYENLFDRPGTNMTVFSNASGTTYWVATEAATGQTERTVELVTNWWLRKTRSDARFTLQINEIWLDAFADAASGPIYNQDALLLRSAAEVRLAVARINPTTNQPDPPLYYLSDKVSMTATRDGGGGIEFRLAVAPDAEAFKSIFSESQFWNDITWLNRNRAVGFTKVSLKQPIDVPIDLSAVNIGDTVLVNVIAVVTAQNAFGPESHAVAYFRDPAQWDPAKDNGGMAVSEMIGLEILPPGTLPPGYAPQPPQTPAPACATGEPRALLEFGTAGYRISESDLRNQAVTITRTGSSTGAVTARVRMSPGTATAGADYTPREFFVRFSDGDAAPRRIVLPLVDDALVEGPETLTLSLVDVAGCADAGPMSTATVTLVDDEPAPPGPPSGTLDAGFGSAGKVASYGIGGAPAAMALQSDGRIVMAGGSTSDFVLARYLADGTLDASFGTGGVVTTDIAGGFQQEQAHAVLVQPDGRIVVAGTARPAGGGQALVVALARYLPDGTLDTTFGTGGAVFNAAQPGTAFAIALQPDGKLVIAGEAPVIGNPNDFSDVLLARYDASGRLDPGFGQGGRVVTDVVGGNDRARNVLVLPDGRIVASGIESGLVNTQPTLVMQVLPDGQPDPAFGTQGKLRLTGALVGWALARQADGKLLLGGSSEFGPAARAAVLRLAADGSLDTGFGTGGLAVHPFTGNTDIARALVVQPDGRIVVAGRTGGTNRNTAVVRLAADGTLDPTFATGGLLVVDFMLGAAGYPDEAERALLQPDGKLLLGGWARDSRNVIGYALVRLAP